MFFLIFVLVKLTGQNLSVLHSTKKHSIPDFKKCHCDKNAIDISNVEGGKKSHFVSLLNISYYCILGHSSDGFSSNICSDNLDRVFYYVMISWFNLKYNRHNRSDLEFVCF